MAACPQCNKFSALNFEEPEVQSCTVSEDGAVTISVRIERTSECCGELMKSADLEMEEELDVASLFPKHFGKDGAGKDGHEVSIEEGDVEQVEEGGGRYAKSYFGAKVSFKVSCEKCQEGFESSLEDKG